MTDGAPNLALDKDVSKANRNHGGMSSDMAYVNKAIYYEFAQANPTRGEQLSRSATRLAQLLSTGEFIAWLSLMKYPVSTEECKKPT